LFSVSDFHLSTTNTTHANRRSPGVAAEMGNRKSKAISIKISTRIKHTALETRFVKRNNCEDNTWQKTIKSNSVFSRATSTELHSKEDTWTAKTEMINKNCRREKALKLHELQYTTHDHTHTHKHLFCTCVDSPFLFSSISIFIAWCKIFIIQKRIGRIR